MTRKWRDNKSLVQLVQLFLLDEVSTDLDTDPYTLILIDFDIDFDTIFLY